MEIKNADLRIGNYISDETGDIFKVYGIHRNGVSYDDPKKGVEFKWTEDLKGIPLTEELLLKMGFEINLAAEPDAFERYRHKVIKPFTLEMFNNEGWVINGLDQWIAPEPFKYLHQLQNKFYFSTDLELTLS